MKISKGNSKLGKIPNISMTPIRSCGNCASCRKDCYALKAYRQYPATRKAWDHNYRQAVNDRATYFAGIKEYLTAKAPKFFRWHVSGDILDQNYLAHMERTAYLFPGTRFLVFTKMHGLNYSKAPDNLRIRFSMWPGMDCIGSGPGGAMRAWMQDGTETRIPKGAVKCPGNCENCKACFNSKRDVYFNKH